MKSSALSTARLPWRAFLAITALVVLLHALVLSAVPLGPDGDDTLAAKRFTARTVVLAPPVAAPAPSPVAKTPPPPVVRKPPAPRRATPSPAPVATPAASGTSPGNSAPETVPASDTPAAATVAAAAPIAAASEPVATAPAPPAADIALPPPSQALAVPGSARLQYTVSAIVKHQPYDGGDAQVLWRTDGQRYEASIVMKLLFFTLRSNASVGAIGADGLRPERFSDKRRSEVAAHFERDKGKISFSANTPDAALMAGAQDRLSLFFQLSALVAGDPSAYPVGTVLAFQTVGPRDAEVWRFGVVGKETLHLPAGEMETLKLQRNPRREWDQTAEIWLAPSLGYLPVRIRLTDANGDMADQRLRSSGPP